MKTTDCKPRLVFQLCNACRILGEKDKLTSTSIKFNIKPDSYNHAYSAVYVEKRDISQ
jgi:hypothetical protein